MHPADDRVFSGHSFKFAARLQESRGGDALVMIPIARPTFPTG
jgi:prolyl oligopeptidase PreP (S9A serine peptidase family)